MCILICYTYKLCPHVAKSATYTCYAAKISGRGFDEKCDTEKITRQKLRMKTEPKRCGDCGKAFQAAWRAEGHAGEAGRVLAGERVLENDRAQDVENGSRSRSGSEGEDAYADSGEAKAQDVEREVVDGKSMEEQKQD